VSKFESRPLSHLVVAFLALFKTSPNTPEEARNCATNWRRSYLERAEKGKSKCTKEDFWRFFSSGQFRGSHFQRVQLMRRELWSTMKDVAAGHRQR
jgi:hypothetical protein